MIRSVSAVSARNLPGLEIGVHGRIARCRPLDRRKQHWELHEEKPNGGLCTAAADRRLRQRIRDRLAEIGQWQHSPECKTVLRIAQSAYASAAFNLWEPQPLSKDLDDTLVLGPQGVDLSGGDALDVNLLVFTKVPLPDFAPR